MIWRLGCIKAIYNSLKGFTLLHYTLCSLIQPGTALSGSSDPLNQQERLIKKVAFMAFVLLWRKRGLFYEWRLTPGERASTWGGQRLCKICVGHALNLQNTHIPPHTHIQSQMRTHTHTQTHASMHRLIHTHTHKHMPSHTHMHGHRTPHIFARTHILFLIMY